MSGYQQLDQQASAPPASSSGITGGQQYQQTPASVYTPGPTYAEPPQQQQQQAAYQPPPQYVQQVVVPAAVGQGGPNQTYVAVAFPVPPAHEVNLVWVNQQVDTTSCYIKILATLLCVYAIYSMAVSANSMYTSGWDIASGVVLLIVGIIGLASAITNKTHLARVYFWSLVGVTIFFAIGYIIVLALIGANPCRDIHDHNDSNDNSNKICEYSVATIRAVLIVGTLITLACCGCCTYCARMHWKNLQLRDNGGIPQM